MFKIKYRHLLRISAPGILVRYSNREWLREKFFVWTLPPVTRDTLCLLFVISFCFVKHSSSHFLVLYAIISLSIYYCWIRFQQLKITEPLYGQLQTVLNLSYDIRYLNIFVPLSTFFAFFFAAICIIGIYLMYATKSILLMCDPISGAEKLIQGPAPISLAAHFIGGTNGTEQPGEQPTKLATNRLLAVGSSWLQKIFHLRGPVPQSGQQSLVQVWVDSAKNSSAGFFPFCITELHHLQCFIDPTPYQLKNGFVTPNQVANHVASTLEPFFGKYFSFAYIFENMGGAPFFGRFTTDLELLRFFHNFHFENFALLEFFHFTFQNAFRIWIPLFSGGFRKHLAWWFNPYSEITGPYSVGSTMDLSMINIIGIHRYFCDILFDGFWLVLPGSPRQLLATLSIRRILEPVYKLDPSLFTEFLIGIASYLEKYAPIYVPLEQERIRAMETFASSISGPPTLVVWGFFRLFSDFLGPNLFALFCDFVSPYVSLWNSLVRVLISLFDLFISFSIPFLASGFYFFFSSFQNILPWVQTFAGRQWNWNELILKQLPGSPGFDPLSLANFISCQQPTGPTAVLATATQSNSLLQLVQLVLTEQQQNSLSLPFISIPPFFVQTLASSVGNSVGNSVANSVGDSLATSLAALGQTFTIPISPMSIPLSILTFPYRFCIFCWCHLALLAYWIKELFEMLLTFSNSTFDLFVYLEKVTCSFVFTIFRLCFFILKNLFKRCGFPLERTNEIGTEICNFISNFIGSQTNKVMIEGPGKVEATKLPLLWSSWLDSLEEFWISAGSQLRWLLTTGAPVGNSLSIIQVFSQWGIECINSLFIFVSQWGLERAEGLVILANWALNAAGANFAATSGGCEVGFHFLFEKNLELILIFFLDSIHFVLEIILIPSFSYVIFFLENLTTSANFIGCFEGKFGFAEVIWFLFSVDRAVWSSTLERILTSFWFFMKLWFNPAEIFLPF